MDREDTHTQLHHMDSSPPPKKAPPMTAYLHHDSCSILLLFSNAIPISFPFLLLAQQLLPGSHSTGEATLKQQAAQTTDDSAEDEQSGIIGSIPESRTTVILACQSSPSNPGSSPLWRVGQQAAVP